MSANEAGIQSKRKPNAQVRPGWNLERFLVIASIVFCIFVVLFYSWRMPALGTIFTGITVMALLPVFLGERIRQKS